jgi:hypothetical protein
MFVPGEQLHVPARVLTGACVVAVLISLASILIGTWSAQQDEQTALRRYQDAEALLALPPVDTTALQEEVTASKDALATAQALAKPASVDPSSDAATSLLVRRAAESGLGVRGIASAPASQAKHGEVTYDVSGIRMSVEGAVTQLIDLLHRLGQDEPGLIPSLSSMTIDEKNVARAEVIFSVYAPVPTPTPVPAPPGGGAR